jgi:sulfopyruvate decarboxylase TPP-binding subunit
MGAITEDVLKICGFLVYRVEMASEIDDIVGAACDMAFDATMPIAVLLSQRLIGRKVWVR